MPSDSSAIDLRFEDRQDYLVVTSSGNWQIDAIKDVIDTIRSESEKRGNNRVLWDLRDIREPPTDLDRHTAGKYLASVWRGTLKVAVVCREEDITKLTENAAVNRGAQFFVTGDEQRALHWLLEGARSVIS